MIDVKFVTQHIRDFNFNETLLLGCKNILLNNAGWIIIAKYCAKFGTGQKMGFGLI